MNRHLLQQEHETEAIQQRLAQTGNHSYLRDFVFGAVDGTVTTFAVVVGAMGADLSPSIAIILGFANLLADGFSMAVGNYLSTRSELEQLHRARRMEEHHIDVIPEGEREEIRQIFANKGLEGEVLEEVVRVITDDRQRWVSTMLTEELGLRLHLPSALRAASSTFIAFFVAGLVPILPLVLLFGLSTQARFTVSIVTTGITFFLIGALKGRVVEKPLWSSGLETFFLGGGAAVLAFLVGWFLRGLGG